MESNTILKWLISKTGAYILAVVLIVSWIIAQQQHSQEISNLHKELYKYALKIKSFNGDIKSSSDFNVTLVDAKGKAVYDDAFGSHTGLQNSDSFRKALKGSQSLQNEDKAGLSIIALWTPYNFESSPHVLIVSKLNNASMLSSFLYTLFTYGLIVFILIFCVLYSISKKFTASVEKVTDELGKIKNEDFSLKTSGVDTEEFTSLYKNMNSLSFKFEKELRLLRSELKQWEVFFSTIPRGLMAIDEERRVLSCNQNALDLLNVKDKNGAESIDQSVMAVFRNADMNHITSDFFESNNVIKEYEFEIVVDSIIETIKVICVQLDISEKSVNDGAMVIMENITAFRRLENMRKDFVANVSHELKTPIAIIGGFAETLKECLDDPATALNFIKIIENNTSRLTYIIDDLLNLSKLEQDESVIRKDFESIDISDTVKTAVELCSHEASKKQIQIKLDIEESKYYEEPKILANHRLLEHAMRNLIENAIRYSPVNSAVTIATRKHGDEIEISVTDNGDGIKEEHHDKIFERFYRVDKSRDRLTGGSGLGLSIVKHIARIHRGRVLLDSEQGQGSTFKIIIPYALEKSNVEAF